MLIDMSSPQQLQKKKKKNQIQVRNIQAFAHKLHLSRSLSEPIVLTSKRESILDSCSVPRLEVTNWLAADFQDIAMTCPLFMCHL